jgi:EAL domain-containing protein (putative c-di-GMP-specific phosphodiesterase class I)
LLVASWQIRTPTDLTQRSGGRFAVLFNAADRSGAEGLRKALEQALRTLAVLQGLRFSGVKLSIDDFGTGCSSLAYLQQLPVTELKIDRSFVQGIDALPGAQHLFKTMVEMGHGMGLMVTVEGVETKADRATVAALGCDVMQGYLGSWPLHGAALQACNQFICQIGLQPICNKR